MGSVKSSLRNWFGYTRRERRSTFILLIIILIVTGIRFIVPNREIRIEEIPITSFSPLFYTDTVKNPDVSAGHMKKVNAMAGKKKLTDLNTCDSASLESLPGIGPVLASRIIKYRNLIGGYASVDQLREVYGLTGETVDLNSGRLYADTARIRKININKAEYRDLIRHPYLKIKDIQGIIKFREIKGKITGISDLIDNKIISDETAKKIRPYLNYTE
jgi:DNA uptake protein ComE-like DNA-binding protein